MGVSTFDTSLLPDLHANFNPPPMSPIASLVPPEVESCEIPTNEPSPLSSSPDVESFQIPMDAEEIPTNPRAHPSSSHIEDFGKESLKRKSLKDGIRGKRRRKSSMGDAMKESTNAMIEVTYDGQRMDIEQQKLELEVLQQNADALTMISRAFCHAFGRNFQGKS